MEKVTFKNSRGLNLAGIFYPADSDKCVVISHGFTANKDRERLIRLSNLLSSEGFAVLRFDFGGSGESDSREITLKDQTDDLNSAIDFIRKKGYNKIALLGESLGGLTSILAYDEKIKTLVLWAPVTKSKTPSTIQDEELNQELNKEGFIIYSKDGRKGFYKSEGNFIKNRMSYINNTRG